MFKVIGRKTYNNMVDEISNLVNALAKAEKKVCDSEETIRKSKDEFARMNGRIVDLEGENRNLRSYKQSVKREFEDYRKHAEERLETFRVNADAQRERIATDKARIEELETELKVIKGKSNDLTEQSLKDKETIQNLKNDIELFKEEIAGKKNKIADLEEKVNAVKTPSGKMVMPLDGKTVAVTLKGFDEEPIFIADEEEVVATVPTTPTNEVSETVLKDGMWVVAPEGCHAYIIPGKAYQVSNVFRDGISFQTTCEDGDYILCRLDECSHLRGLKWTIVPAPEQATNTCEVEQIVNESLDAEELPMVVFQKSEQPGPSIPRSIPQSEIVPEIREQLAPKPNIVGNVKRPYRKTGKFKRK